jgi:hypothetical protein
LPKTLTSRRSFSLSRSNKEEDDDDVEEEDDETTKAALAGLVRVLPAGPGQEEEAARMCTVAKNMFTEEAMRCALLLVRLQRLSGSAEDGERARSIYQALLTEHLAPGATLPVDMRPTRRMRVVRVLEVGGCGGAWVQGSGRAGGGEGGERPCSTSRGSQVSTKCLGISSDGRPGCKPDVCHPTLPVLARCVRVAGKLPP